MRASTIQAWSAWLHLCRSKTPHDVARCAIEAGASEEVGFVVARAAVGVQRAKDDREAVRALQAAFGRYTPRGRRLCSPSLRAADAIGRKVAAATRAHPNCLRCFARAAYEALWDLEPGALREMAALAALEAIVDTDDRPCDAHGGQS